MQRKEQSQADIEGREEENLRTSKCKQQTIIYN